MAARLYRSTAAYAGQFASVGRPAVIMAGDCLIAGVIGAICEDGTPLVQPVDGTAAVEPCGFYDLGREYDAARLADMPDGAWGWPPRIGEERA